MDAFPQADIKVGATVKAKVKVELQNYDARPGAPGKVITVDQAARMATVEYQVPKRPRTCEGCGFSHGLSQNLSNGLVECMRTGCGHSHGRVAESGTVPFDELEPA